MFNYPTDDGYDGKRVKSTKKCVIKRETKFVDYKGKGSKIQRFRSEAHNVSTEKISKIALNSNEDKRT